MSIKKIKNKFRYCFPFTLLFFICLALINQNVCYSSLTNNLNNVNYELKIDESKDQYLQVKNKLITDIKTHNFYNEQFIEITLQKLNSNWDHNYQNVNSLKIDGWFDSIFYSSVSTPNGGHITQKKDKKNIYENDLINKILLKQSNLINAKNFILNDYVSFNTKTINQNGLYRYDKTFKFNENNKLTSNLSDVVKNDFGFFAGYNKGNINLSFNAGELINDQIYFEKYFMDKNNTINCILNIHENKLLSFPNNSFLIDEIDLTKLFKIQCDVTNEYLDNNKIWTTQPKLKIEINEHFVSLLQKLDDLYLSYEHLLNFKKDNLSIFQTNSNYVEWFNIIVKNIFNLSTNYEEVFLDSDNILKNIKPTLKNIDNDFVFKLKQNDIQIPNVKLLQDVDDFYYINNYLNLRYPYQVIINFFKNNKISASYSDFNLDLNKNILIQEIWDGKDFKPIMMKSNSSSNFNKLEVYNLDFININNKSLSFKPISIFDLKIDYNFANIFFNNKGLIYQAFYRENAKNYSELIQTKSSIFNDFINNLKQNAIELKLNKYVAQLINLENVIFDKTIILNNLNDSLYTVDNLNSKQILFSDVLDINDNFNQFENISKALTNFNLSYDKKLNFTRNNLDGIFYCIVTINNWKFNNDWIGMPQGDFTNSFKNDLSKNKNIFELHWKNKKETKGAFLIKLKTNLVESNNVFSSKHNVVDINNNYYELLKPFLTDSNLKFIVNNIKNINNWEHSSSSVETFFNKDQVNKSKLNLNKEINFELKEFNFNSLIDIDKNKINKILWEDNPTQNALHYLWNSSLNFSDEKNDVGKIVSRKFMGNFFDGEKYNKMYNFYLNENYIFVKNNNLEFTNIFSDELIQVNNFKIVNKNNNQHFAYSLRFGDIFGLINFSKNNEMKQAYYDNLNETYSSTLKKENIVLIVFLLIFFLLLVTLTYFLIKKFCCKKLN